MKKEVLLSSLAKRQYRKLKKKTRIRIKEALNDLASGEDKKFDIKRLQGVDKREPLYRLRVGNYRIIYRPEEDVIKVIRVIPRGKGYDWL